MLSIPDQAGQGSKLYHGMKELYHKADAAGCSTIRVIQAGIVVALYDLGHGIYPVAFITIATCIRYGSALGIDKLSAREAMGADREERIRLWWEILIINVIGFRLSIRRSL
jgi:hypothetical protein